MMLRSKKLKVGITGAFGFIGSYLCKDWRDSEWLELRLLSRQSHKNTNSRELFLGDLADPTVVSCFVDGLDILVHLANSIFPRDLSVHLSQEIQNNLMQSVFLFEEFSRKNPNGHLIFLSSGGSIYDTSLQRISRTELDRTDPICSYGIQKLALEGFLSVICSRTQTRGTVLRVSNPYGTLLSATRSQGIIGVALSCMMNGSVFPLSASLQTVRDYLHLSDLVKAIECVIKSPPQPSKCRIFNVGSGVGTSIQELFLVMQDVTGLPLQLDVVPGLVLEPAWNVLNCSKLENVLGWKSQLTLKSGLYATFQDILNHSKIS